MLYRLSYALLKQVPDSTPETPIFKLSKFQTAIESDMGTVSTLVRAAQDEEQLD
jgi:hypothetical protein